MKKKLLMILISIMLIFTLTVTKPVNEVKAFALTTAAIYTTYVLGGLAIASLADQGFNDGKATQAVWDGTKDFLDTSGQEIVEHVQTSIATTMILGKATVDLGARFFELTQEKIQEWSSSMKSNVSSGLTSGTYTINDYTIHRITLDNYYFFKLPYPLIFGGKTYYYASRKAKNDGEYGTGYPRIGLREDINVSANDYLGQTSVANVLTIDWGSNVLNGITVTYHNAQTADVEMTPPIDVFAEQVGKSLDKSFEHSKKQGKLNIPLDGMAALGAGGIGLSFDSATDTWRDNATGEAYLGDIELDNSFVTPRVSDTGATVYNPDIDLPVVDVNVSDLPWTVTNDAAITDALTGEIVTTNTGEATVPIAANPDITKIKWDKLRMAGELFTTAFPFSLPFDIAKGLNAAFGDLTNTSLPDLQVNLFNTMFTFKFPQIIKNYMSFIRAFFLIMFDVGLVYSIRKWFGGAS